MRFLHNIPKRLFVRILVSVSLISATYLSISAQDWRSIHDGVEYAEVTRTIDNQPVRMNLLRLDLKKVRLDVVHAMDAAIGTETVSSMAMRHKALAGINAGFFRLDNSIWAGDPAGIFFVDGEALSEPVNQRVALEIFNNGSISTEVFIDHLGLKETMVIGDKTFEVSGINRERKDNELVLYSPQFHRKSLTSDDGIEFSVVNNKIYRVYRGRGNNPIPDNGFLLSASGTAAAQLAELVHVGVGVTPNQAMSGFHQDKSGRFIRNGNGWDIVGGVPQLVKDGKIDITWQEEKTTKSFVETRHPRTSVAKLRDGKFLMVTVDGRSESSGGISLNDLAAYLLELGATDAMNLDGGGSTTMYLDGKVVNHPSDKEGERKVSDAILVTLRKK